MSAVLDLTAEGSQSAPRDAACSSAAAQPRRARKPRTANRVIDLTLGSPLLALPPPAPPRSPAVEIVGVRRCRQEAVEVVPAPKRARPPPAIAQAPPSPADQGPRCGVCLEAFKEPSCGTCGHVFCHTCLVQAAKAVKKCPMCKKGLSQKQIKRVYF